MNITEAREMANELLKLGLSDYRARQALEESGCDEHVVENVMADYTERREVATLRKKRLWRIAGALLFFGSGGLFLYCVLFPINGWRITPYPLLAFATYGFLKMLLP